MLRSPAYLNKRYDISTIIIFRDFIVVLICHLR